MTLNTMLYNYVNEEEELKYEFVNDYRDDDDTSYSTTADPLKVIEEQVIVNEVQDPCYIQWQMFDEIPERVYTIECEGYFDKNGNPLDDETTIKHLISGETDAELERYENGEIDYDEYYTLDGISVCYKISFSI